MLFALCIGILSSALRAAEPTARDAPPSVTVDHTRVIVNLAGRWHGRTIAGLELNYPTPGTTSEGGDEWKAIQIPQTKPIADDRTLLIESSHYVTSLPDLLSADGKSVATRWLKKSAAWFRRDFKADAAWLADHRAMLRLDGAGFRHKVWLNGKLVGESLIGLVPAEYDVTSLLRADSDNELVIAVGNVATLVDVANKTLLAPASGTMAGIWGDVEIHFMPHVYVADVFITTSVTDKQLTAQVTLNNTTSHPAALRVGGLVTDDDGRALTNLDDQTVTVPAGQQTVVKLVKSWIAPTLWSPSSPVLYHLTVTATDSGKLIDQQRERFGFRQFEIRGREFYLNGTRMTLLRDSKWEMLGINRARALDLALRDTGHPFNCWRLHIGFDSQAMLDAADQIGLLTIPESSWHNIGGRFNLEKSEIWLPQIEAYTRGLIRQNRNRPSVIMWSLTNESMWNHTDNFRMNIVRRVLDAARQADPTRPFNVDGDNSWDGRTEIINIHYPEGEMQTELSRRYLNAGLLYPNMFHWLDDKGVNHSWRADFQWDRPLIIGEYWNIDDADFLPLSSFYGELTFDWERRRFGDFVGRDGRPEDPAIWAMKGMTDVYRMKGVAGLNPWYGDREQAMPPVAVRPLDFHPSFFGGQRTIRPVVIFNQTSSHYVYMQLQCRLMVGEQTVWTDNVVSDVGPGETKTFDIPMDMPAVQSPTPARLVIRLIHEGNKRWPELSRYEQTIYFWPQPSLGDLDTTGLVVVQHDASVTEALKKIGLDIAAKDQLALADLKGARTVLLGPGVDTKGLQSALIGFVKTGGRVIQLQFTPEQTLTVAAPSPDPLHAATRAWRLAYDHPIFEGLQDGMFSFWQPDNLVTIGTLRKQVGSPAKYLLESGGRFGMQWSPLIEMPMGKGTLLLCQMPLIDRVGVEPASGALLVRLIRYAQQFTPSPTHPLTVLAAADQPLLETLTSANVVTTMQLNDSAGPVLVHASAKLTDSQIAQLKQRLTDGGTVWLVGFDPKNVDHIAPLLPFKPMLVPFDAKKTQGAVIRSSDPLIRNISAQELAWYHYDFVRDDFFSGCKPTAELGRWVLRPPTLQAAHKLIEPGLLVKVPVGRGTILFDTLEWPAAAATEHDKVTQLVGSLAMNMGATIDPNTDAEYYTYSPVDISRQANMGFFDPTPNDGKGGWTDQGRNDMRFFLINHVAKQGGLEGGADIAVESMPEQVMFLGHAFKMIDPKKNDGKAIVSLRGGEHGALLPSKAEGIPVNRRADRLWFVQAAGWLGPVGQQVAQYVIHYVDGTNTEFPVRCGYEVGNWWNPSPQARAQIAWTGHNLEHSPVGMYLTTWVNPHPDKVIRSLDVIGNLSSAQFIVVAITAGVEKQQ
ncbi:MAG: glycoside hydrolase family 2 protein [Phycisphaerales bacterium]